MPIVTGAGVITATDEDKKRAIKSVANVRFNKSYESGKLTIEFISPKKLAIRDIKRQLFF